jgi:tryptophan synthase alpha chain
VSLLPRRKGAIARAFEKARSEGRAAFVPYICAGDPSLERTPELLLALARAGADVIELGVPFSDPIADGPTNQRAASRSLAAGTTLSGILRVVSETRHELGVPIVLFSYYNPIHRRGVATFAEQAASSGVDGVLCVDLPPEEAQEQTVAAFLEHGIDSIFLLAPTSTKARVKSVARASRGFVYYVSRVGVTGERDELAPELLGDLERLRKRVKLPIAVGFGISTPVQAAAVGRAADGVVVGSALVRLIEEHGEDQDLAGRLEARAHALREALADGWQESDDE